MPAACSPDARCWHHFPSTGAFRPDWRSSTDGGDLDASVTIHWNEHHIPFIEATSDADAAFAPGLVHGHLRLAQMAMVRMIARGRLSEMVGPLAVDIDHGLRILSFPRAADDIERSMDRAALRWTQRLSMGSTTTSRRLTSFPTSSTSIHRAF